MSVSTIGSTPVIPSNPEPIERPGSDRDGDNDDKTVKNTPPVQAAPTAPGIGQLVNKLV